MGSIRCIKRGWEIIEKHWMDSVYKYAVRKPMVIRQRKSLTGQLALFEEVSIDHLKPKEEL